MNRFSPSRIGSFSLSVCCKDFMSNSFAQQATKTVATAAATTLVE